MPLNRTAIAAACAGALALAAWLLHARPQPKRPPADRAVVAMAGVPPAAAH